MHLVRQVPGAPEALVQRIVVPVADEDRDLLVSQAAELVVEVELDSRNGFCIVEDVAGEDHKRGRPVDRQIDE